MPKELLRAPQARGSEGSGGAGSGSGSLCRGRSRCPGASGRIKPHCHLSGQSEGACEGTAGRKGTRSPRGECLPPSTESRDSTFGSSRALRAGRGGHRPRCPSPSFRPGHAGVGRGCAVRSTMAGAARDSPEREEEKVSGSRVGVGDCRVPRRREVVCSFPSSARRECARRRGCERAEFFSCSISLSSRSMYL